MADLIQHSQESTEFEYTVFVNGSKLMNATKIYDWAFQQGLALAVYLKLEFKNPKGNLIVDKWTDNKGNLVIIQKTQINA